MTALFSSESQTTARRLRPLRVARLLWGSVLLAQPGRVLAVVQEEDPAFEPVVRVLGLRHVLQALVLGGGGRRAQKVEVAIDVLHAVSMVAAAATMRERRRAPIASAISATTWAVLTARTPRPTG